MNNKMNAQFIRAKIETLDNIPAIPPVVRRLLASIEAPNLSFKEVAEVISKDQAITAKLLKMVNSPIYGFPGRISSVSQSLILLGIHVVKGILLGVSVFEIMEKTMVGLWEHSLFTAVTAKMIAGKKGLSDLEEIMTSALLHDIGKIALKMNFQREYEAALTMSKDKTMLIKDAEEEVFSLNHAVIGGWLAKRWNFPVTLSEPIAYHHKPTLAKYVPLQTGIVHVSDMIVRARGIGFAGDRSVPAVNQAVWDTLALSEQDVKEILEGVEDAIQDAQELIL